MSSVVFDVGTLLPRLDDESSTRLRGRAEIDRGSLVFDESVFDQVWREHVDFPSTGGTVVDPKKLLALRADMIQASRCAGQDNAVFDLLVGEVLWRSGLNIRGEFGSPMVWDFITLVLVPDLAKRRFEYSGSAAFRSRLTGGNRRHVFQRLWQRWMVLGPGIIKSGRLTEDDYVALLERRLTSERSEVAKSAARAMLNHPSRRTGQERREYNRLFMRKLLMASGIVVIDGSDAESLDAVIEHVDGMVRRELLWS